MVWVQVALYASAVVGLGATFLLLSHFLSPKKFSVSKLEPYECGVPLLADNRDRFSVRFYLVAIMFILFDVETVFMIPWAVLYKELGVPGLAEVGVFFAVLGFGLVYLWQRGGLEWD